MRYWQSSKPSRRRSTRSNPRPKRAVTSGGSLRQYPFLRTFYQHQAVISDGVQRFLFFLVLATLLYAFVFGDAGAIRILTLRHDKAVLTAQVAGIERNTRDLEDRIERLKNDPFMMEKLGRERYGYLFPGDKVYKIVHPPGQK